MRVTRNGWTNLKGTKVNTAKTTTAAAASQGDDDAGKKRDDVANKLSPADLASAKSLAANFKPRKIDAAVNEPPAPKLPASAPMSLLGAPMPGAVPFTAPPRRS